MTLTTLTALIVTVLFWGSSFVATKVVLTAWPSWAYMFLRFAAASVLFLILLVVKKQLRLPQGTAPKLLLMAVFEPGLYFLFETLGLMRTSASSASILIASIPVVVAIVSAIILKEYLSARGWTGAIISIIGITVITLFDKNSDPTASSLVGNLFILLAVFSAAGYIILARSLSKRISPLQITAYQIFFATPFFLPGIIIQGGDWLRSDTNSMIILAFMLLVIGATFIAFLSYNYALSKVSAPQAAVFINGIPVVTVIVAWLVLGEVLQPVQMIGGALAIGGLMIASRREPATIRLKA